jgi:hypothetical protein
MRDAERPTHGLTLRWVPVTGADGRVRMEARWLVQGSADRPVAA